MSYKVYRDGVLIASPASSPFTDTGLTNGITYGYQVSEVNAVGEGPKAGPVSATPFLSPVAAIFGPGIHMDGIGNTELGGTTNNGNRRYGGIFKASGTRILSFKQQIPNPAAGYSGGDGGLIEYRLRTATPSGPTNTLVGSSVTKAYGMSRPEGIAPTITPPSDWDTIIGDWYAIVAKNIASNPTTNFSSIENIYFQSVSAASKVQPRYLDGQWQTFYSDTGTGGWIPRYSPAMTAQLQINWLGGLITGVGYVYRGTLYNLSTPRAEIFTPTSSFSFTRMGFRATGSGTLTLRLETSGGSLVAQGTAVSSDSNWDVVTVSGTINAGQSYRLIASGSGLSTYSIEKGGNYGFSSSTYFSQGSVEGDSNKDLQFYLA